MVKQKNIQTQNGLKWDYVLETAELMASEGPLEHERTLYIMNSLFAMYLRISELAASGLDTQLTYQS